MPSGIVHCWDCAFWDAEALTPLDIGKAPHEAGEIENDSTSPA